MSSWFGCLDGLIKLQVFRGGCGLVRLHVGFEVYCIVTLGYTASCSKPRHPSLNSSPSTRKPKPQARKSPNPYPAPRLSMFGCRAMLIRLLCDLPQMHIVRLSFSSSWFCYRGSASCPCRCWLTAPEVLLSALAPTLAALRGLLQAPSLTA